MREFLASSFRRGFSVRTPITLLATALVTLSVISCSSSSDDVGSKTVTPSGTEVSSSSGNFRQVWQEPPTLDPAQVSDAVSGRIVAEIFSGLVTLASVDSGQPVIPEIAQAWSVSNGGTTYNFKLRKDALFHDGRPVTAEDVKFSLERALDPATASPVASIFLGDILGAKEFMNQEADQVTGIKVLDPETIEITLEAPRAHFLSKLANPVAFVVDETNVREGDSWTQNPIGTGAFTLEKWDVGVELLLSGNGRYYKGSPRLREATFILSGGQPLVLYESGEIDAMVVEADDLPLITNPDNPLNKELVRAKSDFAFHFIAFNAGSAPFDDRNVRAAFNLAVDKESIAREIEMGLRIPAYGLLPPGFPGHNPDIEGLRFDPNAARQLLEDSKYGDDVGSFPPVTLTVPGAFGPPSSPGIEVILKMWQDNLGVQVELQQLEFGTFIEEMLGGKLQVFNLQWLPDYPDPHAFLDVLFNSESPNNVSSYENPEVDRLLAEARDSTDFEERIGLYRSADEMVVNDAPWMPLWFSGDKLYLVKPYVKGFEPSPLIRPVLQNIHIADN